MLHVVVSGFYFLKSEAEVKPLGSQRVLWETWDPNPALRRQSHKKSLKTTPPYTFCFQLVGLHILNCYLKVETYASTFQTWQKVAREAAPLLSHEHARTHAPSHARFGHLLCYWTENNAPLFGGAFDLKEGGFTIHTVIRPTPPLPSPPDTGISFLVLTFYYLMNLSYYLDSAKSCW